MAPRIVEKAAFHVIGMEMNTTLYENALMHTIPLFWQRTFMPRACEIKGVVGECGIGYEVYDPVNTGDIYHLACFEVNKVESVPVGMVSKTIPASIYAVFAYPDDDDGDPELRANIIRFALNIWLPGSEYQWNGDYTFEKYQDKQPKTELYIPVIKK